MTVREIQGFLAEQYGTEVSPEFISTVTDAVMAEVTAWQTGRWSRCIRWCSSTRCGSRSARTRWCATRRSTWRWACCPTARATSWGCGSRHTEGAKFWMKVFNDLKTRGVADILIAVTDGLKGMAEALAAVFPGHHAADLHRASDPQQPGLRQLEGPQAAGRGAPADLHRAPAPRRPRPRWTRSSAGRGAASSRRSWRAWRRAWDQVIPFFAFPPEVRRVIYTTNAHRERPRAAAQDHQDARPLPERRGGDQADLAGAAQHHRRLGPRSQGLEGGDEPVRDPLRRSLHARAPRNMIAPTCPPRRSFVASDARRRGQVSSPPHTQKF